FRCGLGTPHTTAVLGSGTPVCGRLRVAGAIRGRVGRLFVAVQRLGYIGLGVMGSRMARNLAKKSGLPVIGYDIDTAKAKALEADGVQVASSIREVVEA